MKTAAAAGRAGFDASVLRWRERALDHVLWVGLGLGTVPLLMVVLGAHAALPARFVSIGLGIYVLSAALALARSLPHVLRGWLFLAIVSALALAMLAARGLEGAGRLLLVVLPLYATILLGPRSGYLSAMASLVLYAAAALMTVARPPTPAEVDRGESATLQFWLLQGAMLVFVLAPTMVLLTRFIGLLRDALLSERAATERIARADRERRRLEREIAETGERERKSLGHQLHDGPCQQIAAALLRCRVAQNSLIARGADDEAAHLEAITVLLDASVGEIHDLARGLSQAELTPGAFVTALEGLVQSARASGAVSCRLFHDGLARPESPVVASQLYRIAQEAVGNAIRHASPRTIEIELTRSPGDLRLVVRDDGVGLPAGNNPTGMGLKIMRHRAELVGGRLQIGPAPGGGTMVACVLPLGEADAEGVAEE